MGANVSTPNSSIATTAALLKIGEDIADLIQEDLELNIGRTEISRRCVDLGRDHIADALQRHVTDPDGLVSAIASIGETIPSSPTLRARKGLFAMLAPPPEAPTTCASSPSSVARLASCRSAIDAHVSQLCHRLESLAHACSALNEPCALDEERSLFRRALSICQQIEELSSPEAPELHAAILIVAACAKVDGQQDACVIKTLSHWHDLGGSMTCPRARGALERLHGKGVVVKLAQISFALSRAALGINGAQKTLFLVFNEMRAGLDWIVASSTSDDAAAQCAQIALTDLEKALGYLARQLGEVADNVDVFTGPPILADEEEVLKNLAQSHPLRRLGLDLIAIVRANGDGSERARQVMGILRRTPNWLHINVKDAATGIRAEAAQARKQSLLRILNTEFAHQEKLNQSFVDHLAQHWQMPQTVAPPRFLLEGPEGSGKSYWAELLAQSLGYRFARVDCARVSSIGELIGDRQVFVNSGPGLLLNALLDTDGRKVVILLDEFDKMDISSQNIFHSFLDRRLSKSCFDANLEGISVDFSQVIFVATGNSVNAKSISHSLRSRFVVVNFVGPKFLEAALILEKLLDTLTAELPTRKKFMIDAESYARALFERHVQMGHRQVGDGVDCRVIEKDAKVIAAYPFGQEALAARKILLQYRWMHCCLVHPEQTAQQRQKYKESWGPWKDYLYYEFLKDW